MAVKNDILAYLEQHRNGFCSGELLAKELGVSRAAVWKAVESLKKSGYEIEAVTRKGYRIDKNNDLLSAESIAPFLEEHCQKLKIQTFSSLESTNLTAKQLALAGAEEGTVVLTEEQTLGRGRLGRSFFSPAGAGIYFSIILRPELKAFEAVLITTAAAVAVCRAVKETTGAEAQIKWVNDIYVNERKICGILTEALTGFESGSVECVILGIGLNFCQPEGGFPPELRDRAGCLFAKKPDGTMRSRLAGAILNHAYALCSSVENRAFLEEYRQRSLILGREITVSHSGEIQSAVACAIDQSGGLLVRYPDCSLETIHSGELSLLF